MFLCVDACAKYVSRGQRRVSSLTTQSYYSGAGSLSESGVHIFLARLTASELWILPETQGYRDAQDRAHLLRECQTPDSVLAAVVRQSLLTKEPSLQPLGSLFAGVFPYGGGARTLSSPFLFFF